MNQNWKLAEGVCGMLFANLLILVIFSSGKNIALLIVAFLPILMLALFRKRFKSYLAFRFSEKTLTAVFWALTVAGSLVILIELGTALAAK